MLQKTLSLLLTLLLSTTILGQSILSQERVSFRFNVKNCGSYYVPNIPSQGVVFDVGTGFELTNGKNHSLEAFETRIKQLIDEIGEEDFLKGRFYITGGAKRATKTVAQRQSEYKQVIRNSYNEILTKDINLSEVDLELLTKITGKVSGLNKKSLNYLTDKVRAWFPSKLRHWEKPFVKEVTIALVTTAIIELLTAKHIFAHFHGIDRWSLLTSHALLLLIYDGAKKGMINWITDPNVSVVGQLLKQISASIPFVLSFEVAGNISGVMEFFQSHDLATSMDIVVNQELPSFFKRQSLTLGVQTWFYWSVMSNWLGKWWSAKDKAVRMKAKTVQEVVKVPILMVNSLLFAMASTGAMPIFKLGEYGSFGVGHLGIGLMALTGMAIIKKRPDILDPLIHSQDWFKKKWKTKKEFRALFSQRIRKLLGKKDVRKK